MDPSETLAPGTQFGRYRIIRRLGAGGTGVVYEAEHIALKKRVAIKILLERLAAHEGARERFVREGEASARVRHPHVVDVTDVGMEGDVPFLVMEYLEGIDLSALMARTGPLSPEELADLAVPVCAALAEAHRQGVVHRDLKPANVFVVDDPHLGRRPKLVDFGISKLTSAGDLGLTTEGALLGTPSYMSPEQARAEPSIGPPTDQYSLGVILYEAATGQRAFKAGSMYELLHKIVTGEVDPPRKVAPGVPPALEAAITRAMSVDVARRYPDLSALGLALLPFASERTRLLWEPALRGGGRAAPTPATPPPPSSTARAPVAPMSTQVLAIEPARPTATVVISGPVVVAGLLAVVAAAAAAALWLPERLAARPATTAPSAAIAPTGSLTAPVESPAGGQPGSASARPAASPRPSNAAAAAPSASGIGTSTAAATAMAPAPAARASAPADARCGPIVVSAQHIALGDRPLLALPAPRLGKSVAPLDRALGRACPTLTVRIAREVTYGVAFPTIATALAHSREGVELPRGDGAPPLTLPAGLGAASIDLLAIELTDAAVRFRVLVGGELPRRTTPLGKLAAPLSVRSARALDQRLGALASAMPAGAVVYLGATASTPFGEVLDALGVASDHFPGVRLSWID